jgi:SAM-dependent methyltransferase
MQDIVAERAFYDKLFAEKPENEHIVAGYEELHDRAFAEPPHGAVLDLGCGTGGHAIRLARRGFDVIAVDLTLGGVRAARERLRREGYKGRFLVADAERLPFRGRAVDTTWTSLLIHHFPRLDRLPAELSRVTGRRLIAFEPNALNPLSWFAFNVVNPIWGLSSTTRNQRAVWPKRVERTFAAVGLRASSLQFVHRAWDDGTGVMAVIRRLYTALTGWLPLSMRANKFLIIFDKSEG